MTTHVGAVRRLLTRPLAVALGTIALDLAVVPAIISGHLPVALGWVVMAFASGYAISGSV